MLKDHQEAIFSGTPVFSVQMSTNVWRHPHHSSSRPVNNLRAVAINERSRDPPQLTWRSSVKH